MAATITSGSVSLQPPDIFRYYNGPTKPPKRSQKPDRASKRQLNPSLDMLFNNIDDILDGDLAGSGLIPESLPDALMGPIPIRESEPDPNPDDELPTLEELLLGQPFSNVADVTPAAESQLTDGSTRAAMPYEGDGGDGGDGIDPGGDAMRPVQRSEGGIGALASSEAAVGCASPLIPEDGRGIVGDDSAAVGTDLPAAKPRMRPRSLSPADTTVGDLGTPDPEPERPYGGSHLSKRQRLHLHAAEEPTYMRTATPNPKSSRSRTTASGESRDRMGDEQPGTKHTDGAIIIGVGSGEGGGYGKMADLKGSAYSSNDGVHDELLQPIEPANEPASQPHLPAPIVVGRGTTGLKSHGGDDARWIQYLPPKVTEIFLAVTVQTAGGMLQMSSDEPAKLIESASAHAGKAEDVTLRPLGQADIWQVSGRLRLRTVCSGSVPKPPAGRESTPAVGDISWDLRNRARALCGGAAYGAEVACTTSAKGGGILNDGRRRLHDGGSGDNGDSSDGDGGDSDGGSDDDPDDDDDDDGCEVARRKNLRWDPLDEQRLLTWVREKKPWKWIFGQLPDRTEGAVRVRAHMLRQSARE